MYGCPYKSLSVDLGLCSPDILCRCHLYGVRALWEAWKSCSWVSYVNQNRGVKAFRIICDCWYCFVCILALHLSFKETNSFLSSPGKTPCFLAVKSSAVCHAPWAVQHRCLQPLSKAGRAGARQFSAGGPQPPPVCAQAREDDRDSGWWLVRERAEEFQDLWVRLACTAVAPHVRLLWMLGFQLADYCSKFFNWDDSE